jgi:hypothetical protein
VGVHALVGLANAAYSNPRFIAENRELTEHIFDGNYWHNPRARGEGGVRAYQKRFTHPCPTMRAGYQVTFVLRTRWSARRPSIATRCATPSPRPI